MNEAHRTNQPWTPQDLIAWCEGFFAEKGVETPRLDAELLLAHALGCRRLDLYLQFDRPMQPDELTRFRELVRERARRMPVAYLTGVTEFWSLPLTVRPGCLIPRPDTETLVEVTLEAVEALRSEGGDTALLDVLELGTGTGAIPLAVCSEAQGIRWLAVERSARAAAVAAENRSRHAKLLEPRDNRLWLLCGDGFGAVNGEWQPHLLVSNPPYIPSAVLDTLQPEVAREEPRAALDGGANGLDWYRTLVREAATRLRPGGRLLLEIGADQGEALRDLVAGEAVLELLDIRKDLGGRDRVVHAVRWED